MVLTTTDNQSRNRRFGLALGQGLSMEEAQMQIGQVVEGKSNVKELMSLAERYQQHLPICQQIFEIIYNGLSGEQAMQNILDNQAA
jgi:glycerol-3-phosphate dehydrogenase (NAD(P)+)